MKNIGLLIPGLEKGGTERVVSILSRLLCSEYNLYLIVFEDTHMEYDHLGHLINLEVKAGLAKPFLTFKRVIALKKAKQGLELDYVISFLDSPNVVNILSRTARCKIGISIRNYSKNQLGTSFLSRATEICIKYLYNRADVVIPVSRLIAASMVNDYGVCPEKIRVIYNPYDIEKIRELALEDLEPRYQEFIDQGMTFITVGRLSYQKGFWHLIKAFKLVHDKHNEAKLIIVGEDYQNRKIHRLIDDLQLRGSVLLTGQQDNPFKFMCRSAVYVLPSLFEGFPNAMVEAMSCGCVVVAADCKSGPREILYQDPELEKESTDIEFADFGILVPQMEPEENWDSLVTTQGESKLAEAMLRCMNDRDLRDKYAQKGMERASFFSCDRCKQQFIDVFG